MKTKIIAPAILVAIVLCLAALDAHAFYNPQTDRWLSRDPIAEDGGRNLYGFGNNDAINKLDPNGKTVWWDCVACAAALVGKFGGTYAGCAAGCSESSSPGYPYGQCLSDCLTSMMKPCELWKSFKGNPAERVGAAACISCGVRAIRDIPRAKPPSCDDCPTSMPRRTPKICWYQCGSGATAFITSKTESYAGEFDGGCPKMQSTVIDPGTGRPTTVDCRSLGPFPNDWPPVPPSGPTPPGPRNP